MEAPGGIFSWATKAIGWVAGLATMPATTKDLQVRVSALEEALRKDRDPRPGCPYCGEGRIRIISNADPSWDETLPSDARYRGECVSCQAPWLLSVDSKVIRLG